jgi:hypothetical protein
VDCGAKSDTNPVSDTMIARATNFLIRVSPFCRRHDMASRYTAQSNEMPQPREKVECNL